MKSLQKTAGVLIALILTASIFCGAALARTAEADEEAAKGGALIAYFSRTGNTQQIAELIAAATGGELYRIETAEAYPEDYDEMLDVASREQREGARPALAGEPIDLASYDAVFIGYPIWWGDVPAPVLSFLEGHDFGGKTVIPFCTHGGGGSGDSFKSVGHAAAGATVPDGFDIAGTSAGGAEAQVAQWLEGLGLAD